MTQNAQLKILHMSDLHYDSAKPKDTQIILEALWKDLENFPDIDLILFSGDLVKGGDRKDDFEKSYQVFIQPLLRKTGLSKADFFIVPGNHDIQMSAIDKTLEEGLKARLKNRDSLNSFLDEEMEKGFKHIERLDHFNDFKNNKFNKKYAVTSNKLFSTHLIKKKNINIGIACLNSTWRATGIGDGHDKGKLLIGERQIYDSFQDIKDCDIKIAQYHHSLDWLTEFDLGDAKKILSREFDFLFCGHLHDSNLELVQYFENKAILVQGGCLYKGRRFYNGYSVLIFNVSKGKGNIHLRSYFDNRRTFDQAINVCKDGEIKIDIKIKDNGNDKEEGTRNSKHKRKEKRIRKKVYIEIDYNDAGDLKDKLSLLILTATEIETRNLHHKMNTFPGYDNLIKVYKGSQTYYIGIIGCYAAVHVQCEMGTIGRDGAIAVTIDAIDTWDPKAVLMIGIAFGVDRETQNIGDVLVPDAIIPYNINRIEKDEIIYINPIPQTGNVLYDRFKSATDWNHKLPNGEKAKIVQRHILSGESIIDNHEFRDKLLKAFPNAKGGEMEAAGLYAASVRKNLQWIVVKGISDYADGEKSENKYENQKVAVESAISLCIKVFNTPYGFKELGFIPISTKLRNHLTRRAMNVHEWLKSLSRLLDTKQITEDDYKNILKYAVGNSYENYLKRDLVEEELRQNKEVGEKLYYELSYDDIKRMKLDNPKVARLHQILTAIRFNMDIIRTELGIRFIFIPPGLTEGGLKNKSIFYIAENPITEADWCRILNRRESPKHTEDIKVDISYHDVKQFINHANSLLSSKYQFSLLRTNHWKYVCAAGGVSTFISTNKLKVKSSEPSTLGVYDLCGVIWQFCLKDNGEGIELQGGRIIDDGAKIEFLPALRYLSSFSKSDDLGFRPILKKKEKKNEFKGQCE